MRRWCALGPHQLEEWDLVVASYGWVHRFGWLARTSFGVAVLDEPLCINCMVCEKVCPTKAIERTEIRKEGKAKPLPVIAFNRDTATPAATLPATFVALI